MPPEISAETAETVARDAIRAAVDAVEPQLELAEINASLGLPETPRAAAVVQRRGAGRPPGARNKRTETLQQRVEALFGSPAMRAAALAMMPTEELAARLGCTAMEALVEQRLWMAMVLPYVAQRQPLAIDMTNHNVVSLVINGAPASLGEPSAALDLARATLVDYQGLSDAADVPVAQREVAQHTQPTDNAG